MGLSFKICSEYSEVSQFLDKKFNYPEFSESFTEEHFEKEYDQVFALLVSTLRSRHIVDTKGGSNDSPISMCRHVDLDRNITVVIDPPAFDLSIIRNMYHLLCEIDPEYAFSIDASGTNLGQVYVVVRRSGDVLGYSMEKTGLEILALFGFPIQDGN